jgi:hypothetical protein
MRAAPGTFQGIVDETFSLGSISHQMPLGDIERTDHDGKHIVEIVCDTAREPADSFHLL